MGNLAEKQKFVCLNAHSLKAKYLTENAICKKLIDQLYCCGTSVYLCWNPGALIFITIFIIF